MIVNLLFSILACLVALAGIILLILLLCLVIRDIIDDLKRWYKGDDWGWLIIKLDMG